MQTMHNKQPTWMNPLFTFPMPVGVRRWRWQRDKVQPVMGHGSPCHVVKICTRVAGLYIFGSSNFPVGKKECQRQYRSYKVFLRWNGLNYMSSGILGQWHWLVVLVLLRSMEVTFQGFQTTDDSPKIVSGEANCSTVRKIIYQEIHGLTVTQQPFVSFNI